MQTPQRNLKRTNRDGAAKKILIGGSTFVAFVILIFVSINGFLATVDANQFRERITETLSRKTGRIISLDGSITLRATWKGAVVSAFKISVSNPPWASHPIMATIGRFDFSVSLLPLLRHQLVINELDITNADIMLESESDGRNNWDLNPVADTQANKAITFNTDRLSILDSHLIYYHRSGATTALNIEDMSVESGDRSSLNLRAEYNGVSFALAIKTGGNGLLPPKGSWPFSAGMNYANYEISAEGQTDIDAEKATLSNYQIKAGKSKISGDATVTWAENKPFIQGNINGDSLILSDFNIVKDEDKAATDKTRQQPVIRATHLFSDEPLSLFSWLESVNALMNVKIGEVILTNGSLKQLTTTLNLSDGIFSVAPLKLELANGDATGEIRVNTVMMPPQIGIIFSAHNVALDNILRMITSQTFLTGKADFEINLASMGRSSRELASNAIGVINLVAAGGNLTNNGVSSVLMSLFAPKGSNTLNCLAARFIVKNGIARDNGILMDTGSATIMGKGTLNMGRETIDIVLNTKTKRINIGGLLPAAYVGGTFLDPHFSVDPSEMVRNVEGLVMDANAIDKSVPDIMTHDDKNACIYTLDNSVYQTSPADDPLTPGLIDKATNAIKNVGSMLKGFVGH